MTTLRIIFAGSGAFGAPTLRALLDHEHEIVQVFTQPDKPAGRGKKLTPTPIAQLADELKLPVTRTANINAEQLPEADVMVVIAFGQKIAPPVVNHPRLGSVNLHASLLPKYRGAAPINWAVLRGETVTGNSIIRLAEKMDAGAVLGQSELPIPPTATAGELHDQLAIDGGPLMLRVLDQLASGTATEIEQDHTQATIAPKLSRETATIDWTQPADAIRQRVNGLSPWPGCRVKLLCADGSEIARATLLRVNTVAGEGDRWHPGEIMGDGCVCAANGAQGIEVLDIQPEGKRPMKLADYRRGNRWTPGLRLESV